MSDVKVTFDPLVQTRGKGRIEPRWLAYHFVNYVKLEKNSRATPAEELVWKAPAEYPDELSDDIVRNLPAGRVQPVFVRVTIPRGCAPGIYRGRGYVESAEGRSSFDIALRVTKTELPLQPRLKFVYWFSWEAPCKQFGVEQFSEDGWRVLSRLGELMRSYHQNVVVVPWWGDFIQVWRTADGSLLYDFRNFDRFIHTFQMERVDRLFCLSHLGARSTGEWLCPTMRSHMHRVRHLLNGEEEWVDIVSLLPEIERHVHAMGLSERFCVHVADEPIPENVESYRQLARRVKEAAPTLRRIDAIHVPDLRGALEVWVPQLNYFEKWLDQYRAAQQEGNELWFYVAWVPQGKYPNRMIDSFAIKPRVLHWLNAIYDTSGYLHWALNHWHIPLSSLESPGDQFICWASQRFIANSSLRYEAEREGLEDCELMFLLRERLVSRGLSREAAQAQVEAIARKAVHSPQDYTRSYEELESVREELIAALGG